MPRIANWCGRVWASPAEILRPTSEPELCRLVRRAAREGRRVKVVGARHSFGRIWTTDDLMIELSRFHRVLQVDRERMQITVQGGMPLHRLVRVLERFGLALPNIGAWMEQTVAGVTSTATHGTSGRYRQTLPESVVRMRLVDGRGEPRVLEGAALRQVTLGLFGIITELTLQCRPFFFVRQHKHAVPREEAVERALAALERHDLVDLRWAGSVPRALVGQWDVEPGPPSWRDRLRQSIEATRLWAVNRTVAAYPASRMPTALSTRVWEVLGHAYVEASERPSRVSPWYRGLTYDSRGFAPPHDEIELALPRARAAACLREAIALMQEDRRSAAIEVQVRFSPAIDMALAPNDGRETAWLNLNVFDAVAAAPVVDALVRLAYSYEARAHWAKVIPASDRRPARRHPRWRQWEATRAAFDPHGVFLNRWYARCFGGVSGELEPTQEVAA
ncbi:MAG: FAD-binding protein [Myxococcales bacterium]|nr:FAD-binding protein [Myxococcales bacterium]MCB9714330.1 FAD-binding protein [Myxococcales bacterium]